MNKNIKFNIIAAIDKKKGIGKQNSIPWSCQNDLALFKKLTLGNKNNAIIMGRNTWDSLPFKPLKFRKNIIISKTMNEINKKDTYIYNNVDDAINYCKINNVDEVWIIGGEKIYKEFINKKIINYLYITNIEGDYNCDVFFPEIPKNYILEKKNIINNENPYAELFVFKNTL